MLAWFRNLRLLPRLMGSFALVCALLVLVAYVGISSGAQLRGEALLHGVTAAERLRAGAQDLDQEGARERRVGRHRGQVGLDGPARRGGAAWARRPCPLLRMSEGGAGTPYSTRRAPLAGPTSGEAPITPAPRNERR